jgi:hypothetical protein
VAAAAAYLNTATVSAAFAREIGVVGLLIVFTI